MKKILLLLMVFMFVSSCSIACDRKDTSQKSDITTETPNSIEKETTINYSDNDSVYDIYDMYEYYLWNENVFFVCDHYFFGDYSLAKSGK